jgi:hypothetical protein
MRQEVGAASSSNAPGWSRIIFIAAFCALGGIGFLAASIFMNGRASSFLARSNVAAIETPAKPAQEVVAQPVPKPKAPVNDRFQIVDFAPRAQINKATLARCRSHVEAGRAFEGLSLRRIAEMRDLKKMGESDAEAICVDYLTAEAKQAAGFEQQGR